ncbi:hypothetical protein [Terrarubrum flagellatum]|uniref:hypothetical protein n=1 Tax=Terrirubrum flagellatum TaxID=2895980 RepID=UPI0031456138
MRFARALVLLLVALVATAPVMAAQNMMTVARHDAPLTNHHAVKAQDHGAAHHSATAAKESDGAAHADHGGPLCCGAVCHVFPAPIESVVISCPTPVRFAHAISNQSQAPLSRPLAPERPPKNA